MEKLVSIILPVYNVEQYIKNCLESIQQQTYSNLEVIIVNDGSTDKSVEYCEQICKIDS
ncbi:glycosyltransferase family 2 protein, partial [Streptococcus pneumoniae]